MTVPRPKDVLQAEEAPEPGKSGETDPLIGKVIGDRFRILARIAKGGMSVVYKAEQAPLGRLVAIKVLAIKQNEESDPEFRKRLFLEAATVAKLTHPNTVTVFDYGQAAGGIYYIAMELVNGRTLKQAMSAEGPFPPLRAVQVAKQICRSLREAHRLGLIHRDMKPGNVMLVDRDGEDYVKVLDFGLVKEVHNHPEEDLTQDGVFMGSPKYMAPEQIHGEPVDARTDIYAVGVILYEMLTGRVPFHRDNPMQILMDHIREPVPPMTTPPGVPPIPRELQAVVLKCLEKNPEHRYADMEALRIALEADGLDRGSLATSSTELEVSISTGEGTPVSEVHTLEGSTPSNVGSAVFSQPTTLEPPARPRLPIALAIAALVATIGTAAVFALRNGGDRADGTASAPPPGAQPETEAPPDPAPREGTEVPPSTAVEQATGTGTAPEPSPTPPPADSPPLRTVLLSLRSTPPGAMVRIGAREYGPTPAQVELVGELATEGQELELIFERAGYRNARITRTVEGSSMQIEVRLSPIPRRQGSSSGDMLPETRLEGYRDSPY